MSAVESQGWIQEAHLRGQSFFKGYSTHYAADIRTVNEWWRVCLDCWKRRDYIPKGPSSPSLNLRSNQLEDFTFIFFICCFKQWVISIFSPHIFFFQGIHYIRAAKGSSSQISRVNTQGNENEGVAQKAKKLFVSTVPTGYVKSRAVWAGWDSLD